MSEAHRWSACEGELCHATVRFPAHRVVRYLRSGGRDGSESSDSDSDNSGSSGSSDSSGDGGGARASGRHRLWRIPT